MKLTPFLFQSSRSLSNTVRPSLTTNGLPLAFDLIKTNQPTNKAPIIIMHGLLGNKLNNRTLGKLLNSTLQRDVYLLDMRNHGSSPVSKDHDYKHMAADVFRFMQDHNINKPVLIGHSMGAKVVMTCVIEDKECASMGVCLDNAPVCKLPTGKFVQYMELLQEICRDPDIVDSKGAYNKLGEMESNLFVKQFLMTTLKRVQKRNEVSDGEKDEKGKYNVRWGYEEKIPLDILKEAAIKGKISEWDFDPRTSRWAGPMLFLRGTESDAIADEYIPTIGLFFPNFELRDVKAGHYLNVTKAQECAELVAEFIDRHDE